MVKQVKIIIEGVGRDSIYTGKIIKEENNFITLETIKKNDKNENIIKYINKKYIKMISENDC